MAAVNCENITIRGSNGNSQNASSRFKEGNLWIDNRRKVVHLNVKDLDRCCNPKMFQEAIEKEKERIKKYFTQGAGLKCNITSLYFHLQTDR